MLTRAKKMIALATSATLMLSACLRLPPTESPIPQIRGNSAATGGKTLVVMLPGVGDRAETFVTEEFFDIANGHDLATIGVDGHLGYYRERSLVTRMREDVILPARAQGYDSVWLLGISMGGFGALLYAQAHPDDIDGLILLAPWLGGKKTIHDVGGATSLADWHPAGTDLPAHEIDVWRWLQEETAKADGKPIVLGYGKSDHLASTYAPLLDAIPGARVHARDGGHKWTTWRPLWAQIASELAR